jgi:hypothetical protein
MKLENLQITLAQRTPWQAMDLGLQVARQHYKSLFIISFLVTSLLALLLFALSQNAIYASLLLFWFKPIIERPLLFYISRAIFSEAPSLKQSLLSLKGIANRLWFKTLFIHRLSISRSFNAPVELLEGLQGEARSDRLRILHTSDNGSAWLTMLGIHIEWALQMTLLMVPFFILPSGILELDFFQFLENNNSAISVLSLLSYIAAVAIVAPFYICCGFILYLNQRTHLEAWDIELGFKKISSRLASLSTFNANLLILTLVSFLSFSPTPSWAEEPNNNDETCSVEDQQEASAAIEEYFPRSESTDAQRINSTLVDVLNSDAFGEHYKDKDYSLDWDWNWDFDPKADNTNDFPWLSVIKDLALYFKYLIITLLALLLSYILIKYQPWQYLSRFKKQQEDKPQSILGMDMNQQNLPNNFINIIENHLTQQQFRQALSLMFRAHLINAIHVRNIPFKQSNTEQECLVIMQAHSPESEAQCFSKLVMHWQMLAYAHQSVNPDAINTLFKHWQSFVTPGQEK